MSIFHKYLQKLLQFNLLPISFKGRMAPPLRAFPPSPLSATTIWRIPGPLPRRPLLQRYQWIRQSSKLTKLCLLITSPRLNRIDMCLLKFKLAQPCSHQKARQCPSTVAKTPVPLLPRLAHRSPPLTTPLAPASCRFLTERRPLRSSRLAPTAALCIILDEGGCVYIVIFEFK